MANACLSGCFMRLQCSSHAIYKFFAEIEQLLCIPKPFIVLITTGQTAGKNRLDTGNCQHMQIAKHQIIFNITTQN